MKAWLALTTKDPVLIGAGYDDDASRYYSWDEKSSKPENPSVGDAIALWDRKFLLGVSFIESIEIGIGNRSIFRCPNCMQAKLQHRRDGGSYCPSCKARNIKAIEEEREVETYCSHHESGWIDLGGDLDASQLRSLCYKPKTQHSIRELDWDRFVGALKEDIQKPVKRIVSPTSKIIAGGHKPRLVKVRSGQQAFRKSLLDRYGEVCALSGPAPSQVIDAAHLYSYADVGQHDDLGGLLIRKDLHRLFDLGLITVDPSTLKIRVDDSLSIYPIYQSLNEESISVNLLPETKRWLKEHKDFHS
jgi:hypothetical protein